VADIILAKKGITAADLRRDLQDYKRPIAFPLSAKIHFRVQSRHFPEGIGYNVVGYVEGSDPNLKKECLVYGGHLDHCGQHMGLLFPGANDNASGSAVVMEVAQAFSRLKKRPKRSVVFVLFGGEEMGLQGSTYFADHVPAPFDRVDAMFNFDMVGEGDGVGCSLSPEPEDLKLALERADERVDILSRTRFFRGVGVRGSDFAPFYQKGIPCISFASNGPHLAYHLSGDTIYRINPDIMADTARLAFLAGAYLADR
jgi:Zn-dependent M28 family amino/carboxypeptidase